LSRPSWWLAFFPMLQVLRVSISPTDIASLTELLIGYADTLLGLTLEIRDVTAVGALLLEPICHLRKLRRLKLDGRVLALPACLGVLPLLELDVRGLKLQGEHALPSELGKLGTTLVSFIGYSQGKDQDCPSPMPPSMTNASEILQKCRPRPSWDPGDGGENQPSWQCPWNSWAARLNNRAAPWWYWQKMERFWVDANFLHGDFPEELAKSWPAMRSLDLQLNEISGPLPSSLATLHNLSALRLHRNRFEGEVPSAIFSLPNLRYMNLEGNSGLHGCVQATSTNTQAFSHGEQLEIQGTGITGLCSYAQEL